MKKKSFVLVFLLLAIFITGCGGDGSVSPVVPTAVPTAVPAGITTINGQVFGRNGQPVGEGCQVILTAVWSSEDISSSEAKTTDSEGCFSFTGAYSGEYNLEAVLNGESLGVQTIVVASGNVYSVALGLSEILGTLKVVVADENGNAVSGFAVSMTRISASSDFPFQGTDAEGTGYYIFYLIGGNYRVEISAPNYETQVFENITVTGGEETVLNVVLSETQVSVSSVEPSVCLNTGAVPDTVMEVKGTGFSSGITSVFLTGDGGTLTPSSINVIDGNTISCSFNFTAAGTGEYILHVTNNLSSSVLNSSDSSAVLENSFFIFDTIQKAVDKGAALYAERGDGVQVKVFIPEGTYSPSEGNTFPVIMKSGVHLLGAGKDLTVFDGESVSRDSFSKKSFEVDRSLSKGNIAEERSVKDFSKLTSSDVAGYGGLFYVSSVVDVTIEGFTMTGGRASISGGAMYCFECRNTLIKNNRINYNDGGYGGGVAYEVWHQTSGSSLVVEDNIIEDNWGFGKYGYYGGGLYIYLEDGSGACEVKNNTITNNYSLDDLNSPAAGYGGGICIDGVYYNPTVISINGNIIKNNITWFDGGGIYALLLYTSNASITNNTIEHNTAIWEQGGGVYVEAVDSCNSIISSNTVSDNYSGWEGGGIYLWNRQGTIGRNTSTVENNTVTDNITEVHGGGIFVSNSDSSLVDLTSNTIEVNVAGVPWQGTGDGGGIYALQDLTGTFNITDNKIISNGHPRVVNPSDYGVNSSSESFHTYWGGGIYIAGFNGTVKGNTVTSNYASNNGDGIYIVGMDMSLL